MARRGLTERDADAMVAAIVGALRDAPLRRRELATQVVAAVGEKARRWVEHSWGGILHRATLHGHVVFGPDVGNEITFALRKTWLRGARDLSIDEAELALLRGYLRGYGPATVQDFAAWAGLSISDARAVFERLGDETVRANVDGASADLLRSDAQALRNARIASPVTRLLPSFDSYLLGHDRKDHLVDATHYKRVYRKAGWLSPTILVDGRVAGVWGLDRKGKRPTLRLEPFRRLTGEIREGVEAEVDDIGRFLGAPITLACA